MSWTQPDSPAWRKAHTESSLPPSTAFSVRSRSRQAAAVRSVNIYDCWRSDSLLFLWESRNTHKSGEEMLMCCLCSHKVNSADGDQFLLKITTVYYKFCSFIGKYSLKVGQSCNCWLFTWNYFHIKVFSRSSLFHEFQVVCVWHFWLKIYSNKQLIVIITASFILPIWDVINSFVWVLQQYIINGLF